MSDEIENLNDQLQELKSALEADRQQELKRQANQKIDTALDAALPNAPSAVRKLARVELNSRVKNQMMESDLVAEQVKHFLEDPEIQPLIGNTAESAAPAASKRQGPKASETRPSFKEMVESGVLVQGK